MSLYEPSRGLRILFGIAGFLIFVASAPCILFFVTESYVTGFADTTGLIGIVGMALMIGFLGSCFLYMAFRRPKDSRSARDTSKEGAEK